MDRAARYDLRQALVVPFVAHSGRGVCTTFYHLNNVCVVYVISSRRSNFGVANFIKRADWDTSMEEQRAVLLSTCGH